MVDMLIKLSVIGAVILLVFACIFAAPSIYIIGINLISFLVYGYDKIAAIKHWDRVPERFLWFIGGIGGTIGSIVAMFLFHHKTQKRRFYIPVMLIFFAQLILFIFLL